MSEFFVDTSYKRKYVVVSATSEGVVLRPVEDGPLSSYWQDFISGYISEPLPPELVPTIHLTQVPQEVISVNAYADYVVEYPHMEVHYGGHVIDISDRVSVNHPNPETPGLYALDFMVSTTGEVSTPIWRSWLSIEEPPLLRNAITPWNRENLSIADINRLIIEPQFTEALYEAGVPLYNFQQANANNAVGQFALQKYKNSRAFVKSGRIFISGPRLPIGTKVSIQGVQRVLKTSSICAQFSRSEQYLAGDIVTYCGSDYYALEDIPTSRVSDTSVGSVLPTESMSSAGHRYWLQGAYYVVDYLDEPDGEYSLDSLWSIIDVNGYLFNMDLLRAIPVHHYWGIYDRKKFYDYAPGDLVTVINDGVISLYQRNETPLDDRSLEQAYRPGHYLNPNWTAVYSESQGSEITNPIIRPYSNASNAFVSKTYSAREESFRMYSNMVGIPSELVDMLGAKYSVILWAILYRTRETFPGIRAAFNAIGLDISNLRRAQPSVIYTGNANSVITDVYDEIDILRKVAKSIEADRIWMSGIDVMPPTGTYTDTGEMYPPWVAYSDDGASIWLFDEIASKWNKVYAFNHIGSDLSIDTYDFSVNNRYYKADLNLLERLSSDGALDLGDSGIWVSDDYFTGLSLALSRLLSYEVPIYIYLRLRIKLATTGNARISGVSGSTMLSDAWCGNIGLKLYPGKIFNFATYKTEYYYPQVLFAYDYPGEESLDSDWQTAYEFRQLNGYRYYAFNHSVYLRLVYSSDTGGVLYKTDTMWTSRYTIGCLGNMSSSGTDDYTPIQGSSTFNGFMDASMMPISDNPSHSRDLYLCKGIVGCTLRIHSGNLSVRASCLQWNYVFDDPSWKMDETLKFADWRELEGADLLGCWASDAISFKQTIVRCTSPDVPNLKTMWGDEETPTLYVGNGMPHKIMMYDANGFLRGMVTIPYNKYMVLDGSSSEYILKLELA